MYYYRFYIAGRFLDDDDDDDDDVHLYRDFCKIYLS